MRSCALSLSEIHLEHTAFFLPLEFRLSFISFEISGSLKFESYFIPTFSPTSCTFISLNPIGADLPKSNGDRCWILNFFRHDYLWKYFRFFRFSWTRLPIWSKGSFINVLNLNAELWWRKMESGFLLCWIGYFSNHPEMEIHAKFRAEIYFTILQNVRNGRGIRPERKSELLYLFSSKSFFATHLFFQAYHNFSNFLKF